jgi:hypothetical protein
MSTMRSKSLNSFKSEILTNYDSVKAHGWIPKAPDISERD